MAISIEPVPCLHERSLWHTIAQEADLAVLTGVRIGYASVAPPPGLPPSSSGTIYASYDPSVVVAGGSVFLLATECCLRVALRPWSERIEALTKSGDWLPALALAMVSAGCHLFALCLPVCHACDCWQDHCEAVSAAYTASINAAEIRAKWAAFRASAMVRRAAFSGASLQVASSATAGPASRSVVSATPVAASVLAAAAAAAAAQYDPARFERLRAGPGPTGK